MTRTPQRNGFRHLFAATAAIALAAPGFAAAQNINNRQQVMPLTFDGLADFLADAGWQATEKVVDDESVIVAEIEGKTLVLWPRACDGRGICAGLLTFAVLPTVASAAEVNAFNIRFPAARATLRGGQVIIDSYTFADFGVVRGSLLIELAVLAGLVDDWWEMTAGTQKTRVSFSPILAVPEPINNDDFPFAKTTLASFAIGNQDQ